MVMLPDARAPEGMRLYAIGDVHGCADLLAATHARIEADLARRPAADWRVIHLGDYADRGPDSRAALELLLGSRVTGKAEFLIGNHDRFLLDFLTDPRGADFDLWMANGGVETLDSFGINGLMAAFGSDDHDRQGIRDAILGAMPPDFAGFLAGLSPMLRYGDYAFVHAGVRPGVPLERQELEDLIWMREPFLSARADHGAVVVHGHTPAPAVELRPNRIGIDTGAFLTGNLTCLVLEGAELALLGADGPEPLSP